MKIPKIPKEVVIIISVMTSATIAIGGLIYFVSILLAANSVVHLDAFVTVFSTVAGGSLAFGGVWWTIIDQNRQRKEDQARRDKEKKEDQAKRDRERRQELAIQYKPILQLDGYLESHDGMYYRELNFVRLHRFSNESDPKYKKLAESQATIDLNFSLINVGRGCLANSKIIEYSIKDPDIFDNCLQDWKSHMSFADLTPGSAAALVLCLPQVLRIKSEFLTGKPIRTTIKVVIKYTDEFNVHEYKLTIYFTVIITPIDLHLDSGEEGITIVSPKVEIEQAMPRLRELR